MRALDALQPNVPLPKGWPRVARCAIVHAIALAHFVITHVRGWCLDSRIRRVRVAAECERLRSEVAMLREELRIKDARLARIPPRKRPHYPSTERLAILVLRAARGWNAAQTAARFLVEPATIAHWMGRIDEDGANALVRTPGPVNRFPEFVRDLVGRLKATFPALGSMRIANMLARAGLHVARTTVRRILKLRGHPPAPVPSGASAPAAPRSATTSRIISRGPNHTWLVDLTIMPTVGGFWVPWIPLSFVQRWPFCWWVAVVMDHFSRAVVGFAVFKKEPTAAEVCAVLDRAAKRARRSPKYVISDQGVHFRGEYLAWCARRGVRARFGAVGEYGSIAVIERFIKTLKEEGLRRILVPLGTRAMNDEVAIFVRWYNGFRPHMSLGGATPNEIYGRRPRARDRPRFEPRASYPTPRGQELRGKKGDIVRLTIGHHEGRPHLPVIHLRAAA